MRNNFQKYKIKIGQNGEICVDYGRVGRTTLFRYNLLQNIIVGASADVTLMIDTNQRVSGKQTLPDVLFLAQQQLRYAVMPTLNDPQMFFGFKLTGGPGRIGNEMQMRIIIDMEGGVLTEKIFDLMAKNDVAIGFGRKKTFEQLCEAYRVGGEKIIFDRDCYEYSLYDSVVCARIRSTIDICPHLEAVKHEMGL